MTPPFLSDAELDELCAPLKQGAAQIRYLRSLGIKVDRKRNGRPLVWRADLDRRPDRGSASSNQPNWSRRA